MKSLFYILALLAVGGAGYLGFEAKKKYEGRIVKRDDLIKQNNRLSDSISEKKVEKKDQNAAKTVALTEQADNEAKLRNAVAKKGELARTLDDLRGQLALVKKKEEDLDAALTAIRNLFPDIPEPIEDNVEAKFDSLVETQKKLENKKDELTGIKESLEKKITELKTEMARVRGKIAESVARVSLNTFEGTITEVVHEYGFVKIGAGSKSGLEPGLKLLVVRGGSLIGKVQVEKVEAGGTIANILPKTFKGGTQVLAGDKVILEEVNTK